MEQDKPPRYKASIIVFISSGKKLELHSVEYFGFSCLSPQEAIKIVLDRVKYSKNLVTNLRDLKFKVILKDSTDSTIYENADA